MSPFLPTFFTVVLVEIGSTNAQFSTSLTARGVAPAATLRSLGVITAVVMAVAAAGGYGFKLMEPMNTRVVTLLLGMSLIWAAIAQFRILKPLSDVEGQAADVIALRGYARLAITGSAGFLVFAIGLYSGGELDGLIGAALGGWMGVMVANLPPVLLDSRQVRELHLGGVRQAAAVLLALAGFLYALTALKLI